MCSNERVASARMFVLIAGHRCHVESERDFRPLTTIAADMGLLAAFLALSMGAWAIAGVQLGAKYDNFVSDGVRLPVLLVGFGVFLLFWERCFAAGQSTAWPAARSRCTS